MKKRNKLNWKAALASVAALSLLAACSNSGGSANDSAKGAGSGTKPPVTLTHWTPMNPNASSIVKSLSEVTMVPEWEKRTNVKFNFQHPSGTTNADILQQYGVMVASGDIPDMMSWYWSTVPGGLTKMQSDGIIIKLNDLIDKYAPNLKKIMDENPQISKQIKMDNGDILVIPHLRTGQYGNYRNFSGLMIRKDWLDELGLSVPETIDEWEVVLKAFKEKKGAIPFIPAATIGNTGQDFLGAFNISNGYFVENGKVKYGPLQSEFKQYLALMQKWFKEGLIDQDYATNDGKTVNAKISSGKAGAFYGYIGSTMGALLPAMKQTDPKAELVAVQYPVLKKGTEPKFIPTSWEYDNFGTVITKNDKHPEETLKAMDYLFSPEGNMLKNFGTEGVSYTTDNGQPKYTDLIMKNPEKLSLTQALSKNTFANYPWTGLDDDRYNDQYYQLQEQKDAIKIFTKYEKNAYSVLMPPVSMTTEESKEYAKISSDISTYLNETITKIVFGKESVDSYDKAIEQIKKMNIDRTIQIQQAAYDRFNKR